MVSITAGCEMRHPDRRSIIVRALCNEQSCDLVQRLLCEIELFKPLGIGLVVARASPLCDVAAGCDCLVGPEGREEAVRGTDGDSALHEPGTGDVVP